MTDYCYLPPAETDPATLTWAAFVRGEEVARSDDLGQLLDIEGATCRRVNRLTPSSPAQPTSVDDPEKEEGE